MKVSMTWRRLKVSVCLVCALTCLMLPCRVLAAEYQGAVTFNGLPLPGATVTATQDGKKFVTVTDEQGLYSFADLPNSPDGANSTWTIRIEMVGFAAMQQDVTVAPTSATAAPVAPLELKMLPVDAMIAQTKIVKVETGQEALPQAPAPGAAAAPAKKAAAKSSDAGASAAPAPSESASSSDGFLVNGSVNNAATSQFTLAPAFGNNRTGSKSLYNSSIFAQIDNSAFDARPYSLTPFNTPKSAYNKVTGGFTFGGPLNIPRFMPHGPNFFVAYQWTRNHLAATDSALVPTAAQGTPPPGSVAAHLLALYPQPTPGLAGNAQYNYQTSVLSNTHQDAMQTRLDKTFSSKNQATARFAFQSTRSNNGSIFKNFVDTTDILGINAGVNWNHHFNQHYYLTTGFGFSRLRTEIRPYYDGRENISGEAGIQSGCTPPPPATPTACGNDQDRAEWGPPTLVFSSGIASLTDVNSAFNRNRTDALAAALHYYRGPHNFTFGADFRRQENNILAQQNPRGTFQFITNSTTNTTDFSHFLSGTPDTSAIAYGNADKYFRQSVYDAYALDDWRIRPELTLNLGLRWEYGAPLTELRGRLVNLDVAPGFTAVAPVLANSPAGPLTGQQYPTSLIRPDKLGIEPRIGLSWRPIPGSSLVVRAGYGIYDDTSVYFATALQMAQQAPLSTSVNVSNSVSCPQTLATGFTPCPSQFTAQSFGVDPKFRVGYAQTWQVAVQRDLPWALQMTATYLGVKGTRGVQHYLPNSYAIGGTAPACTSTPCSGFTYQSSNGNSTREAASLQLRRRLRSGFTATLQYTYSKSIDDDSALGGQGQIAAGATGQSTTTPVIAQNWLNLSGERSLSSFDQRHLLNVQMQYTTGMGMGGGTLLSGWRGRAFKEWTVLGMITAGTGLPETPVYFAVVPGTNYTGSIRPSLTGAPIYTSSTPGSHLNLAAYTAPATGQWGDAGRDSITGPGQFNFNTTLQRTFRLTKRYNLDVQFVATNILNHTVISSWNTTINPVSSNPNANQLFGLPASANPMRSLQTSARLRF